MLLLFWIIGFLLITLFSWWVVLGGGAEKIEDSPFSYLFTWAFTRFTSEQIRFYIMLMWFVALVVFIIGLCVPSFREYKMGVRS